jgi:hypothetical protein
MPIYHNQIWFAYHWLGLLQRWMLSGALNASFLYPTLNSAFIPGEDPPPSGILPIALNHCSSFNALHSSSPKQFLSLCTLGTGPSQTLQLGRTLVFLSGAKHLGFLFMWSYREFYIFFYQERPVIIFSFFSPFWNRILSPRRHSPQLSTSVTLRQKKL